MRLDITMGPFTYIKERLRRRKRASLLHKAELTETLRREELFTSTYCNHGNQQWKQLSWPRTNFQTYQPLSLRRAPLEEGVLGNMEESSQEVELMAQEEVYTFNPHMVICNSFWKSSLTLNNFKYGDPLVDFGSLWPEDAQVQRLLLEMHQATSLRKAGGDLLRLSLRCGPLRVLRSFVELGIIGVEQVVQEGQTLLHLACVSQNLDSVLYLSTAGARSHLTDSRGRNVYQVCNSPTILKLLPPIEVSHRGAPPGSPPEMPLSDKEQQEQVFDLVKEMSRWEDLQLLLQQSTFDVNSEKNEEGDCLLHVATRHGVSHTGALLGLVRLQQADVDVTNDEGLTSLMIAATHGQDIIADVLLCVVGADPNYLNPRNNWTALHYAVCNSQLTMVSLLIKRGADFNLENSEGRRADEVLPEGPNDDCIKIIWTKRAERQREIAQLVVKGQISSRSLEDSDLFQVDEGGDTLLMMAARHNRVDNLQRLLQRRCAPIDAQNYKTGQTALAIAASQGHVEVIRLLLSSGAAVGIKDIEGHRALDLAVLADVEGATRVMLLCRTAWVGLQRAVQLTRSEGIRRVITATIGRRQTELVTPVLFECAVAGNLQRLVALLQDGDNVNPVSGHGDWPLYLAAANGHLSVVKFLHQKGGDICCQHSTTRNTVLHVACKGSHVTVVTYILENYALAGHQGAASVVNLRDGGGRTALQVAADQGYSRIVQLLLQSGASTALVDATGDLYKCRAYQGLQLVIERARQKHTQTVMAAIRSKKGLATLHQIFTPNFDHHLQDAKGDSPLMVACYHGNLDTVSYLLQCAVTLEMPFGAAGVHFDSVKKHCPDQPRRYSPACHGDADSAVETDDDDTELALLGDEHLRCNIHGFPDDVSVEDFYRQVEGRYELRVATMEQSVLRNCMLGGSVSDLYEDMYLTNLRRQSPCCRLGHICSANRRDGSTALHRAIEAGDQVAIVTALITADHSVLNVQNFQGLSALHVACKLGRKKVVRLLLGVPGLDTNCRTLDGSLPEELTTTKALRQVVQGSRSRLPPHGRGPSPRIAWDVSRDQRARGTKDSHKRAPSVAESTISFESLNTRFLLLKSRWMRKQELLRNQ